MLTWFFLLLLLAVALVAGGLAARSYLTGEPIAGNFFGPKSERRLGLVEQTTVDNRRKLLLVRRDGIEHLIMTGGPVDLVIETGIGAPAASAIGSNAVVRNNPPRGDGDAPVPAVFGRASRNLGQVVNE